MTPETKVDARIRAELSTDFLSNKGICDYCHREVIVRLNQSWHSKGDKVWHEVCSYQQQIEELRQKVALAQAAAYERAAQAISIEQKKYLAVEDNDPDGQDMEIANVLDGLIAEIRALGSASALELALAEARMNELGVLIERCTIEMAGAKSHREMLEAFIAVGRKRATEVQEQIEAARSAGRAKE